MTAKAKNKVSKKGPKKLKIHKETLRDLSARGKARDVRGGIGTGRCQVSGERAGC